MSPATGSSREALAVAAAAVLPEYSVKLFNDTTHDTQRSAHK